MAILKYPLATEKAVKLVESENVVTYVADSRDLISGAIPLYPAVCF